MFRHRSIAFLARHYLKCLVRWLCPMACFGYFVPNAALLANDLGRCGGVDPTLFHLDLDAITMTLSELGVAVMTSDV